MQDVKIAMASGMTLGEVNAAPQPEIEIWELYLAAEPDGFDKLELYLARLTMVVAGLFSKRKPKMQDFMIEWKHREPLGASEPEKLFDRIKSAFATIASRR